MSVENDYDEKHQDPAAGGTPGFSSTSFALSESEAEDLADLTAVFVYLKNDCGYQDLPTRRFVKHWCFAQQNRWDLSNYSAYNMKSLGEELQRFERYRHHQRQKCKSLARDSLSLRLREIILRPALLLTP